MTTAEQPPWWDLYPDELPATLLTLRAKGWALTAVKRDVERETVELRLEDLSKHLQWLDVKLGPGTPSVGPTLYGPQGPVQHIHPIGGNLCLPVTSGVAEAVEAAVKLYDRAVNAPGTLVDLGAGAAEPRPQFLKQRGAGNVLVALELPKGEWGTGTFHGRLDNNVVQGWVAQLTGVAGSKSVSAHGRLNAALESAAARSLHRVDFLWARITDRHFSLKRGDLWELADTVLPGAEKIAGLLYETSFTQVRNGWGCSGPSIRGLIVPEEGPEPGTWHEQLILLVQRDAEIRLVVGEQVHGSWTRVPERDQLIERTVAFAGLGMLGGRIAIDLARTGLGEVRLLDQDDVEVGNLLRQPYDVGDLGHPKATALRRQLQRAAPWTVAPREHTLSYNLANMTRQQVAGWLEGSDAVVLAGVDVEAGLYLAQVARTLHIPAMWTWVGLGIRGAATLTTVWGDGGCRLCLDYQYDKVVQIPEDTGAQEIFARGCGHPTFPGNVIDGHLAAAVAGRSLIAALLDREVPGNLAVVELGADGDTSGPTTRWDSVPIDPRCGICNS